MDGGLCLSRFMGCPNWAHPGGHWVPHFTEEETETLRSSEVT